MKGNNYIMLGTAAKIQTNWNSMNSTEKSRNEDTCITTTNGANDAVKRIKLGPLQSFLLCPSQQWYGCTTNIH